METMTKREVARNTPRLWEKVSAGKAVYVLEHGQPRYKVTAVTRFADPIEQLRDLGLITMAIGSPQPMVPMTMDPRPRAAAIADFEAGRDE